MDLIEIDSKNETFRLKHKNWFKKYKIKEFHIKNITYTYKTEAISRTLKGKTLRIYNCNKTEIRIHFDSDGWTEDKLDEMVRNFNKIGIKRKFIGYLLKDEYPSQWIKSIDN